MIAKIKYKKIDPEDFEGEYSFNLDLKNTEPINEVCGSAGCKVCSPEPDKMIPVDDVYKPKCSNCGKDLLK